MTLPQVEYEVVGYPARATLRADVGQWPHAFRKVTELNPATIERTVAAGVVFQLAAAWQPQLEATLRDDIERCTYRDCWCRQ